MMHLSPGSMRAEREREEGKEEETEGIERAQREGKKEVSTHRAESTCLKREEAETSDTDE